jgi:hypothetical protein
MYKILLSVFIVFSCITASAQELNASITIDAEQTGQPNQQVFKTLESQLTDFINNTQWTTREFLNQERIDCNFTLILNSYEGDSFGGTLQVQASRPVYSSTYDSPIYNYNDKQFSFDYVEFQPLTFNINTFDSNLMSVLAYHIYTVIGLDADSYELNGGGPYFETAKQIVNTAASSNFAGWKSTDGIQSRFRYNDALLSNVYQEFHEAMYIYHMEGMDLMHNNPKISKTKVQEAVQTLKSINDRRPNSFILRTFFDAKSDEIAAIFSGGPKVNITQFLENLNRMAPTRRSTWADIKF